MKTIMIITTGQQVAHMPRGFAALSPERRKAIARQGARRAHELGTAYKWNSEAARAAGSKGGLAKKKARAKDG